MPLFPSNSIHDPARLVAVRRLAALEPGVADAFDRLARLAAIALDAPGAMVTLVGDERQRFIGAFGLREPLATTRDTPLSQSLCQHAVTSREALIVEDTRLRPELVDHALIVEHDMIAYAGIPLITPAGQALGTLCVVDGRPRAWSERDLAVLRDLAASAVTEIELHFRSGEQRRVERVLRAEQRVLEAIGRGAPLREVLELISTEVESVSGDIRCAVYVRDRADTVLRLAAAPASPESYTRLLQDWGVEDAGGLCARAVERGEAVVVALDEAGDEIAEPVRAAMLAHGFHAAWSYPIHGSAGSVLGCFAVACAEPREPEPREVEAFHRAARLAAIALERAAADGQLRVQERSLSSLLEGVVVTDPHQPDNPILYANAAVERVTGYSPESMLGRNYRILQGPDTDPAEVAAIDAAVAERHPYTGDVLNYQSDGTPFWNRLSIQPVHDDAGVATHLVWVIQDVTRQRDADRELAAAEAHYRQLVDASPQSIFALDASGVFVGINAAGERVLARARAELIGRPFGEVVAPRDVRRTERALRSLVTIGQAEIEVECHVVKPSGAERLLCVTLAPVWTEGRITGVNGISRDITGEKEAERHLRRAERLASMGTLLAGVAHELNNPLAAIKSFALLMLMDERPDDDRESLEMMRREADRAAKIVADLRVLARQTAEVEETPREAVDLNEVVRHVLRLRAYSLGTHDISVLDRLGTALPHVLAHRGQLEQVVLNLVINAEQAMEGGARAGRLEMVTHPVVDGVQLDVIDSGSGIAPENLERVFDPFFTTKAPGEGTGLGLSLLHGIVEEHGGEIRVTSEPGRGATFSVVLPLAAAAPRAAPVREAAPAARPLRVLVVDDETAIRRAVVRYLARRGHRVDEAAEGEAALRLIAEAPADDGYDVVLSDLRMPGLGGEALLMHLRRTDEALAGRLIFFTGDASSDVAARILADAGVPVLVKPFELANLAEVVERRGGPATASLSVGKMGTVLLQQAEQIRNALVARLRYDAAVPHHLALTDSDLEDHTCTLLADLAQALTIHAEPGPEGGSLSHDGKQILHFISGLHGAQRARLGWSEAALRREYQILREEIGAALREHAPAGQEISVANAMHLLEPLLDAAEHSTLAALRAATPGDDAAR